MRQFVDRLALCGERVSQAAEPISDCRDPDDNCLLALALGGAAEVVLTEDQDRLTLDPWRGIRIMRLVHFVQEFPLPESPESLEQFGELVLQRGRWRW